MRITESKITRTFKASAFTAAGLFSLAFAVSAAAQEATPPPQGGFFEDGLEVGSTRKSPGATVSTEGLSAFGTGTGVHENDFKKRTAPPALVPDIERSNAYSVPTPTPRPSPTPVPTPAAIATPDANAASPDSPVHTESGKERSSVPRSPEYYRNLIDQVKEGDDAPVPKSSAAPLKPAKRKPEYTF